MWRTCAARMRPKPRSYRNPPKGADLRAERSEVCVVGALGAFLDCVRAFEEGARVGVPAPAPLLGTALEWHRSWHVVPTGGRRQGV
jgi:hypothetical protein